MFEAREMSNSLSRSIVERDWSNVYQHLSEASLQDENGYALHVVCSDPTVPISIVRDIYNAYPQAVFAKDNDQHTPLYIAVDFAFEGAVEFLVNTCPEDTVTYGSYLRSAVHSLISSNIIDSFLVANPLTAFIPDENGDSAFDLFFRIWNVPIRLVLQNLQASISKCILDNYILQGNWKIKDIYQKACLFLKAANLSNDVEASADTYLLHSVIREESCHWAFCKLFINLNLEQVLLKDVDGNLPIHIVTSARNLSDEESFLCIDCFTKKSKLVHRIFLNGNTDYCCQDCSEREQRQPISETIYIEPGT